MARAVTPNPAAVSREPQVQSLMDELRPQLEARLRSMVERALEVPEAEEFGAIEYEFRNAGLDLANTVRQATLASRKKGGTSAAV